jgi:hypothetical protein
MTHTKLLDIEIDEDNDIDLTDYHEVKHLVIDHLHKHGVSKVVVEFSGGNDEGDVDKVSITFTDEYFKTETIDIRYADYKNLHKALCSPVDYEYGNFATEGHVDGQVTWLINSADKNKSTVLLTGQESVEHWEDIDKEL